MQDLVARFGASWEELTAVAIAGVVIYLWVIAATRLVGLRSFAKMSAFDFAMTVAIGSIIASIAIGAAPLVTGVLAVAVLFGSQYSVARLREGAGASRLVDNSPLLLMHDGQIIDDHLTRARLTPSDLMAKLREANVLRLRDVKAVIFETTGDVTVLHGQGPIDPRLLEGVRCGTVTHSPDEG